MSRIRHLLATLLGRPETTTSEESRRQAIRRRTQLRLVRHCERLKRLAARTNVR